MDLSVARADDDATLHAVEMSESEREEWKAWEIERLLAPLKPKPKPPPARGSVLDIASGLGGLSYPGSMTTLSGDARSEAEFRQEVEDYAAELDKRQLFLQALYMIKREMATVRLQIVNTTDRNFEGVQAVVDLHDPQAGL